MDVLSDVVAGMRVGRPHSSRTRKRGTWGVRFGAFAGAGFHVVLQGGCWLFPNGRDPVPLGVGDVVCLPHGPAHGLADSASTPLVEISAESLPEFAAGPDDDRDASTVLLCGAYFLDRSRPHPLLAELPEFIHLPARIGVHASLRAAIDLLGAELEDPGPGTDAIVSALLDTLLLYMLRAWHAEQVGRHAASGWAAALADPAVGAALRVIHDDPARQWTVATLAAAAGLSRAAFSRRFTERLGQPPLAYLTWWRMTRAAHLLRGGDAPLSTIAGRCGYTSQFAFAKAFKREFGMPPGGYRRHHREPTHA